jgi:Flp pilus assembly protein TadD
MKQEAALELDRLLTNVAWAMERGLGARDLVPMLEKVVARAPRGSNVAGVARCQLAELLVERSPWRAARLAQEALAEGDDDRAWGVLGLAHTLLENYDCAKKAYLRALALSPGSASYAHNLGHLLDVALGNTREGLPYLHAAHRAEPADQEIAASYALALARSGRLSEACELLTRALGETPRAAYRLLSRWLRRSARRFG